MPDDSAAPSPGPALWRPSLSSFRHFGQNPKRYGFSRLRPNLWIRITSSWTKLHTALLLCHRMLPASSWIWSGPSGRSLWSSEKVSYTNIYFHQYHVLQSLPFLSELMDKICILLCDLFMDRLPAVVWIHILSESINDPPGMAQRANELWMIWGRGASVQTLSENQFEDVNAIPLSSHTWGSRSRSIISTNSTSNWDHGSSTCWYQRRWRDNGYIMLVVCSRAWWIWSWMTFPSALSILMTFL